MSKAKLTPPLCPPPKGEGGVRMVLTLQFWMIYRNFSLPLYMRIKGSIKTNNNLKLISFQPPNRMGGEPDRHR